MLSLKISERISTHPLDFGRKIDPPTKSSTSPMINNGWSLNYNPLGHDTPCGSQYYSNMFATLKTLYLKIIFFY